MAVASRRSALNAEIEAGTPLSALSRHFGSRVEALNYFAAYQEGKYRDRLGFAGQTCCKCDGADPDGVLSLMWAATLTTGAKFGALEAILLCLGRVGIKVENTTVTFVTSHPLCSGCARGGWWRKALAMVINFIAFGGLLIGLFVGPMFLLSAFFVKWKPGENWPFILIGVGGVAMVAGYPLLKRLARSLEVPPGLRSVAPRPFQYSASSFSAV